MMALFPSFDELSLMPHAGFYPNLKTPPCSEWPYVTIGSTGEREKEQRADWGAVEC